MALSQVLIAAEKLPCSAKLLPSSCTQIDVSLVLILEMQTQAFKAVP